MRLPFALEPYTLLGSLGSDERAAPVFDAVWYVAGAAGDGLLYHFPAGSLAGANYLTADMLLDGESVGAFRLELQAGDEGPVFTFDYGLLPGASARMRLPLDAVQAGGWVYAREGAWVKPVAGGQWVDLRHVDRLRIVLRAVGGKSVRWCMTPLVATAAEPLKLAQPVLPQGALLDSLGQSTLRTWRGKSSTVDEVVDRLQTQLRNAPAQYWPEGFSKWGGWQHKQFIATGFFHTQWDAGRWWLVDPEGCAFWSAGQGGVCPHVEANITGLEDALTWLPGVTDAEFATALDRYPDAVSIDFMQINLMRAFGPNAWPLSWAELTLGQLCRAGFNTIGSGSDWLIASETGFPYVRTLEPLADPQASFIYRDFPDVFDPAFQQDAARFAQQLQTTRDDSAMIGYFLMNEPAWRAGGESPAMVMLFATETCASRRALADFLRERYGDDENLAKHWGDGITIAAVIDSVWDHPLNEMALADLTDFSAVLVETYFETLSAACQQADPNHLNLGVRCATVPPEWCLNGMHSFDVLTLNGYAERVSADVLEDVHNTLRKPVLIGEWHIGALDVGLPSAGLGPRVRDQMARGAAYRVYLEQAAALPWCVGVHHAAHYDQPALGRYDGEAGNIGFYDICHRPYDDLIRAARIAHERLYPVALGEETPFDEPPAYMPPLSV